MLQKHVVLVAFNCPPDTVYNDNNDRQTDRQMLALLGLWDVYQGALHTWSRSRLERICAKATEQKGWDYMSAQKVPLQPRNAEHTTVEFGFGISWAWVFCLIILSHDLILPFAMRIFSL